MSLSKWHPSTSLYDYNYGVGINFYQPMIDYIEEKQTRARTKYPHLPWTEERGLRQYDPNARVKSYSCEALDRIARRTEASAKERLRDFQARTKSSFQLSKSVEAATISEKVQVKKETRKKERIVKEIRKLKTRMADDVWYDRNAEKDVERVLKATQKHLRGKSAKAIESYLESESRRNIAQGVEFDLSHGQTYRKRIVNVKEIAENIIDKSILANLEEKCVEPLDRLSRELKGFDKRTAEYFFDKR